MAIEHPFYFLKGELCGPIFSSDEAEFERMLLEVAREKSEEHVLKVADEVQREMGEDGSELTFAFEQSHSDTAVAGPQTSLGKLNVTGPSDKCDIFLELLQKRMGQ
jgi:hypothetical protein